MDRNFRKDKPRKLTKKQRADLQALGFHRPLPFAKGKRPAFDPKTAEAASCEVCGLEFAGSRAVCPRCQNCVYCGAWNGTAQDDFCVVCGNTGSQEPPEPPIYRVQPDHHSAGQIVPDEAPSGYEPTAEPPPPLPGKGADAHFTDRP